MATLEQIAEALRRADAAGNVDDARALAAAYKQMKAAQTPAAVNADAGFDPMRDLPIPGTSHPTAPDNRYRSPIPGADTINEYARSFGENIPILGPLATRGADAVGSQIASGITGRPAEQLNAEVQQVRQQERAAQPAASAAGAVSGSVGPLLAAGATQLGGQLLGVAGPMGQRIMAGLTSGGLLAGGDSAARGDGIGDVASTAFRGAGLGAVFPMAERAISPILRALTGQNASKSSQAIARNLERDGINPAVLDALLEQRGPQAVLADLGPNMTRQAGAIASLPGRGQSILRDALVERQQGANARIQTETNNVLGPATTPRRFDADVRTQQQALSPQYEQAFANSVAVDTAPIALNLDSAAVNLRGEAQTVARRVRDMFNVIGTDELDPNPRTLFEIRKAIDGMFDTVQDGNARRLLSDTRRQVDDMLAQAVPGIKAADAQFSNLAQQRQAFTDGMDALDSGKTALRPTDLQDVLGAASDDVTAAFSQGTRAEIDRLIGTSGNNVQALRSALKGDGSWNRDRLATVFGEGRAQQLIDLFERELTYNRTYNTVLQNSETAARTAAQKEAAPRQFGSGTSVMDVLMKIPQAGANVAARSRSEAVNAQIAEALMSRAPPELVDQLIAARQLRQGAIGSSAVPLLTNQ